MDEFEDWKRQWTRTDIPENDPEYIASKAFLYDVVQYPSATGTFVARVRKYIEKHPGSWYKIKVERRLTNGQ